MREKALDYCNGSDKLCLHVILHCSCCGLFARQTGIPWQRRPKHQLVASVCAPGAQASYAAAREGSKLASSYMCTTVHGTAAKAAAASVESLLRAAQVLPQHVHAASRLFHAVESVASKASSALVHAL